ncbi:XisH family protein [Brasilonema sp. CT11]|nr:XisH family protein [Brasilonema sp. CT11]
MSAKDIFHEAVKQALQKEQWIITHDPLKVEFGDVNFQIDLGAQRVIAAHKQDDKIAVEIKSFLRSSAITEFYSALGQFLSYRLALEEVHPDHTLYVAVPLDIYKTFFQLEFTLVAVRHYYASISVDQTTH